MTWLAGLNHWALPGTAVRDAATLAQQAGFDALELNLDEAGEVSLATTAADARALRAIVEGAGLRVGGLSTALYWRVSPTAEDAATRARARTIAARQLELAAELGAGAILVVPGVVGRAAGGPLARYDVAYERAAEFLAALAPAAERAGVDLAIENVWNKFLLSPLEMRRLVDEVGSPRIGVYFDVGNILNIGYPEQWLAILGHRVRRVHLKDFRREPPGFVDIGGGDVDWPAVGAALRDGGYDGTLTAEVTPTPAERADLALYAARVARDVRAVMARMGAMPATEA
jgi:L-ribulose-5-phosphate 3-epimerase